MRIVRKTLAHLVECPDAVDTAEGILQWWLKGEQQLDPAALENLLEYMVAEGWLVETKTGASSKLYGVNGSRVDDIRAFLERTSDSEGRQV